MDTESKDQAPELEEVARKRRIIVELEQGSVSVSMDGLTFSISGRNVKLHRQNPLILTFDSGEVQFDDNEIAVRAEGDAVKLHVD